jgi:aspartyl/asparaginyl beta-hydroxylase (cupin superfamily)
VTAPGDGAHDGVALALVDLLRSDGAGDARHAGGRTLLDHLVGTYRIVRRWEQPVWLQHAALIHSVYGTEAYDRQLLPVDRREELAAAAGTRAERLAYLFHVTPRAPLLAGTHLWARDLPPRGGGAEEPATRDELDALVLLHMANVADQAQARDGSPGRWLARVRDLAERLLESPAGLGSAGDIAPPPFTARLAGFSEPEEAAARAAYVQALGAAGDARVSGLALAAALCPVVPEPCVWLAYLAHRRGDAVAAGAWTAGGHDRLELLGTAWDKRLTFEEWEALLDALGADAELGADSEPLGHPRALLEAVVRGGTSAAVRRRTSAIPDADHARRRFQRYVDSLGETVSGAIYPDLPSRPWYDPEDFPIVGYLEANFETIREEILTLEGDHRFHRESERIGRSGDWDVAFFYERGRRHDDVCAACPTTTRAVETYSTVRTLAGLIYVSRMRAATHIEAHRGPTNLRVRCHLGIQVPDGDCAIRVGDETRRWRQGGCLVFDDYLVHEAWNHTDEDRIVLIVDLWHPGLSDTEIMRLEALHGYAYFHAGRLGRYWSANARAAGEAAAHDARE